MLDVHLVRKHKSLEAAMQGERDEFRTQVLLVGAARVSMGRQFDDLPLIPCTAARFKQAALRKVQAGELGRRLGRRPHPGTHVPIDGLPEGFARRACASLVAHAPHASMDAASASLWWAGA